MSNLLFLDDDQERARTFKSAHPYAVLVETADECTAQLIAQDWDMVCLDHDLGGEIFVDIALANSGSGVVRWIEINKPKVKQFVVHSFNPGASHQMVNTLRHNGYECNYMPFGPYMINHIYAVMSDMQKETT